MDLMEYLKGKDKLENKEKLVFDFVDRLDKESTILFDEVVSANLNHSYKYNGIVFRVQYLSHMFNKVSEALDYIGNIELNNICYANRRFQLKRVLTSITTVYAFLANPLLGITSYILLSKMANASYVDEIKYIEENSNKFDSERFDKIKLTFDNCNRIMNHKAEEYLELLKKFNENPNNPDINYDSFISNIFIKYFFDGTLDKSFYEVIDEKTKNNIVKLLQEDLNVENDNLIELLEMTKENEENNLKMVMKRDTI